MTGHESNVARQFGAVAEAYVASATHAQGDDLVAVAEKLHGQKDASVLDMGCGGGHLSFAMAPEVGRVTSYDLSTEMLGAVAAEAERRGLTNISTVQGRAEELPFPDASFDFVCTRYSAHHWTSIAAALKEMRRVLRPGGMVIVIDVITPESGLLDTHLQAVELLRDGSHVRDLSSREWRGLLSGAGFDVAAETQWKLPLEFGSWVKRMRTPELHVVVIRSIWEKAPREVLEYFQVTQDGSFAVDVAMLECRAS